MRLLADENFPSSIVAVLRKDGHDVFWALTDCSGCKDTAPLDLAEKESRILLTLDKAFWQIALQRRIPLKNRGVVLFRTHPATAKSVGLLVNGFLEANRQWAGHISIIGEQGIQMIRSGTRLP